MTASKSSETDPDAALFPWLRAKGMKESLVEVRDIPGRGRGLTATQHVAPGAPLFTIPNSALLNMRTLHPQYPSLFESKTKLKKGLIAPQLLALHLFVHRQPSTDADFGPYIDSLPREFDTHPLAWRVRSEADPIARELLEALPQSVLRIVETVHARFLNDWRTVASVVEQLRQQGHFSGTRIEQLQNDDDSLRAFLWAWLCVNTRSIYYKLSPSPKSSDNITLCPLLDFANHPSSDTPNSGSSVPTFHAPTTLQPGDEVFLNYGPHSDTTLFAEYGFVTAADARAEVDLGPELEPLVDAAKREALERAGYWGEWTLHLTPTPHPSFRTMTALRLLHVQPDDPAADLESSPGFRRWQNTLTGLAAIISEENEALVRTTLEGICSGILRGSESENRSGRPLRGSDLTPQWAVEAWANVHALWDERRRVAKGVLEACRRGDEF